MITFKTLEQLSSEMMSVIKQKIPQITNFKTGGVLRLFIEVVALFLSRIYEEIEKATSQLFVHTSTGKILEQHAEELGITRYESTKTFGKLTLYREATENNITIPPDKIFSTYVDNSGKIFRFKSIATTIFPKGKKSIEIAIIAEDVGKAYNVAENTIVEIITPISGIDRVNNNSGWITVFGRNQESDESLRSRCLLVWKSINGANSDAYISWAKSVVGVSKVKILDVFRGLGTVDILILGENNAIPSTEIIDQITTIIQQNKPIGSDILVKSPTIINIDLDITVAIQKNCTLTEADIYTKIIEFFQQIDIGENCEESALNAKIFELTGITSVTIKKNTYLPDQKNLLKTKSTDVLNFQIAKLGKLEINITEE
ncbi:MAG: baseplate J/gp47 family protein [Brevinema sp.]